MKYLGSLLLSAVLVGGTALPGLAQEDEVIPDLAGWRDRNAGPGVT